MEIYLINDSYKVGFHVSKYEKTLSLSLKKCMDMFPISAAQIYLAGRKGGVLPDRELYSIRKIMETNNSFLVVHGGLFYNLCGGVNEKDEEKRGRYIDSIVKELGCCEKLNCGLILHMGSHKKVDVGKRIMADSINKCLSLSKDMTGGIQTIVLENSAGEGNKLGYRLEDIEDIHSLISPSFSSNVKLCMDTAHAHGAGIIGEIGNMGEFLERVKRSSIELHCFHLNDSKVKAGSKVDRHQNLCEGHLFDRKKLELFMERTKGIPCICEPPGSPLVNLMEVCEVCEYFL